MSAEGESMPAVPIWPSAGVLRVHPDPLELPRLGDEPGGNRFDDPRPRTEDRFLMRYTASSLRGCLLELLDWLRDNADAIQREASIDVDDADAVDAPFAAPAEALESYLSGRKVATITCDGPEVVSIDDPVLQSELDDEPGVRAVLDGDSASEILLVAGASMVHLDNAAIRLASPTGRNITQACALALYDRTDSPDVIHYRSRHDDSEDCWAIYDHVAVVGVNVEALSSDVPAHKDALFSVASMWGLSLPPAWSTGDALDD